MQVVHKEIPGFPGYCVGSDGFVWSCKNNRHGFSKEWHLLKGGSYETGHRYVNLSLDNKIYHFEVQHLVLEAFVGPCPLGMEACHNNGNPGDNSVGNLRWGTRQSNRDDMRKHGTDPLGSRNPMATLNEARVLRIREQYATGKFKQRELAAMNGVERVTVTNLLSRKTWKHI